MKWIFSTNLKNIGTLYFLFGIWSGMISLSLSILIRLESSQINSIINNNPLYNVIVTIHAFIMICFMTMPIVISGFGNWLIPMMMGRPDVYHFHV